MSSLSDSASPQKRRRRKSAISSTNKSHDENLDDSNLSFVQSLQELDLDWSWNYNSSPESKTSLSGFVSAAEGEDVDVKESVLDPQQQHAVNLALSGKNVFLSGGGGVGKSFVTKEIIRRFESFKRNFIVCAPTGIAALHVGGRTIHNVSGIGVPTEVNDFFRMFNKKDELRRVETIIIDEISMISGEFFDNFIATLKCVLDSEELPQFILCGDFFQLPPVGKRLPISTVKRLESTKNGKSNFVGHEIEPPQRGNKTFADLGYEKCGSNGIHNFNADGVFVELRRFRTDEKIKAVALHLERGWAFQSNAWTELNLVCVLLKNVYRQSKKERRFIQCLQHIRTGDFTDNDISLLNSRFIGTDDNFKDCSNRGFVRASMLAKRKNLNNTKREESLFIVPTNKESSAINEREMELLKTPWRVTVADDWVAVCDEHISTSYSPDRHKMETKDNTEWHQQEQARRKVVDLAIELYQPVKMKRPKSCFWNSCLAPERLSLKKGARVILLTNLKNSSLDPQCDSDQILVNGSTGVITRWATEDEVLLQIAKQLELVKECKDFKEENEDEVNEKNRIINVVWEKLNLALQASDYNAITLNSCVEHNYRTSRDDEASTESFWDEFIHGLARWIMFSSGKGKPTHPMSKFSRRRGYHRNKGIGCCIGPENIYGEDEGFCGVPCVRFQNGIEIPILPALFRQEFVGVGFKYRLQLPLRAGFAISVHKSQGMSIDSGCCSLEKCFDYGQSYTALSRVRSLEGLKLSSLVLKKKIKVSREVKAFYTFLQQDENWGKDQFYKQPKCGWSAYRNKMKQSVGNWRKLPIRTLR
eukprot:g4328.t1